MASPHVLGIARAGAQSNDRSAQASASPCHHTQALQAVDALQWIGMNHVERPGDGGHRNFARFHLASNFVEQSLVYLIRHGRQPGTGKVELHAMETVANYHIEYFLERWANECLREDANS